MLDALRPGRADPGRARRRVHPRRARSDPVVDETLRHRGRGRARPALDLRARATAPARGRIQAGARCAAQESLATPRARPQLRGLPDAHRRAATVAQLAGPRTRPRRGFRRRGSRASQRALDRRRMGRGRSARLAAVSAARRLWRPARAARRVSGTPQGERSNERGGVHGSLAARQRGCRGRAVRRAVPSAGEAHDRHPAARRPPARARGAWRRAIRSAARGESERPPAARLGTGAQGGRCFFARPSGRTQTAAPAATRRSFTRPKPPSRRSGRRCRCARRCWSPGQVDRRRRGSRTRAGTES